METYPLSVEMLSYKMSLSDMTPTKMCSCRKYPYPPPPPQKGLEFPGGGGSVRPKILKKCLKLNWNFQRGMGGLRKIPSVEEVWIFSGTTQSLEEIPYKKNGGAHRTI